MGIFEKLIGGNVLYYPGCLTKFVMKDFQINYQYILKKIGIDFIRLKDIEVCCGSPALNAGYKKDFETLARKNLDIFKKHAIKKIITSCPACYKTFNEDYPEVLGKDWDIEIEHITQTIFKATENGKLVFDKKKKGKVTYHDPCHLGRHSGIYDEPRKILENLGYEVVELRNNRENSMCCGGGGGVRSNFPELSFNISQDVLKDAEDTKTSTLVTACPMCDSCFIEAAKDSEMDIKELSELVIEGFED